jgi:hypothetical protein
MIKYNDLYAAVKAAFPSYRIDPSAGSISILNKLQSVSLAVRSNGWVAVNSSVSGLYIDLGQWEQFETVKEAIEFALSVIIKPEDQPDVDLNDPSERSADFMTDDEGSDEVQPAFIEAEIVDRPDLIGLS